MLFKTKLFRNINQIFYTLKERVLIVQNSFSLALFALFLGFLCGNLFGTFLDTLRIYFFWNGFVALIILLFIETINFVVYRIPLAEKINTNLSVSNVQNSNFLFRSCYYLPRGVRTASPQPAITNLSRGKVQQGKPRRVHFSGELAKQRAAKKRGDNVVDSFLAQLNFLLPHRRGEMNVASCEALLTPPTLRWYVRRKSKDVRLAKVSKTIHIERSINAFKIGLLFGFFIDSFKVGS